MFSTAHEFSKQKLNHRRFYNLYCIWVLRVNNYHYILFTGSLNKCSSSTQSNLSLYICILIFLWSSLSFYMLTLVSFNSPFQVTVSTRSNSWWIRRTTPTFELGSVYTYNYFSLDIHWAVLVILISYWFSNLQYY